MGSFYLKKIIYNLKKWRYFNFTTPAIGVIQDLCVAKIVNLEMITNDSSCREIFLKLNIFKPVGKVYCQRTLLQSGLREDAALA